MHQIISMLADRIYPKFNFWSDGSIMFSNNVSVSNIFLNVKP